LSKNLLLLKSKNVLYIELDSTERVKKQKVLEILFNKTILTDNNKDAFILYRAESPDLIIITYKTVDIDALTFIKQSRLYDYKTPIIVVSNGTEFKTLLEITNLSIDAYLKKPVNMKLFYQSIYQSIKRNSVTEELIALDEHLLFNTKTKELSRDDSIITLGVKELQLLTLLIKNRSKITTKEEIQRELWPMDFTSEEAIKKIIFRLRKKLTAPLIVSKRGIGYRLNIKKTQTLQHLFKSA